MSSLAKPFSIVTLSTLASRLLGLVRDLLMAAFFGAGRVADIFFIAFMVPNLFRRLVAEGALSVTFIPVYTGVLVREGRDEAAGLASAVLAIQTFAILAVTAAGILFAPELMNFFFGRELDPASLSLAVNLSRIMFPFLVFASFVSFAMGYLNSHGVFFAPAFAPVLLNVGMISGIVFSGMLSGEPVYGAAAGVLAGGLLQALLQVPFMVRQGFRLRVSVNFHHPGIKRIFATLVPAVFGIAAYQVNALVGNILAAMITEGSVSYIYYTNRLTELVIGVFIVSIGNSIFPAMSRVKAMDDHVAFANMFSRSVTSALFMALPASAGLIAMGLPIVSVIFMRGNFSYADSVMTYSSLVYAGSGIAFVAVMRVVTQALYTMKETVVPVLAAAVSVVVNLVLGYILMHTGLRHAGLALAGCVASMVHAFILVSYATVKMKSGSNMRMLYAIMKYLVAAGVMAVAVYVASGFVDWQTGPGHVRAAAMLLIVTCGAAVYFLCCLFLRAEDAVYLAGKFRGRIT